MHNPGKQCHHYKINKWIRQVSFEIINDIIKIVTLVQLMDTVVNVNHAVIIVGYWIFYSNYKKVTYGDNRFIESHIVTLGWIINHFQVWNSILRRQIHQQHRETKYLPQVYKIFIEIQNCKMNDIKG